MNPRREPDTDALVARAERGDLRAGHDLLARHRKRLRRTVALRMDRRMAVRIDQSDVVQDVLMSAALKLPEYLRSRPLPFYPWLRQLAFDRLVELGRVHVQAKKRSVCREEPDAPGGVCCLAHSRAKTSQPYNPGREVSR